MPNSAVSLERVAKLQDFYGKWLSTPGWREERLVKLARRSGMPDQRIRASLESNQVPVAFSFVDVCGGSITEDEIQLEHNTDWLEQWLESFSLDLPTQKECQAALTKVAKESDSGNKKETPKTPAQEPEACPAKKPKLTPNQEASRRANLESFQKEIPDPDFKMPSFEQLATALSFTVRPSADLKTLTNPSPIAVLLQGLGAFHVSYAHKDGLADYNSHSSKISYFLPLKTNKKNGLQVSWSKFPSFLAAWKVAKVIAGWCPASSLVDK
ncbi:unnamed protein product [Effrenium voratum]|nr:unnamed protein product [Effrenium voratum]